MALNSRDPSGKTVDTIKLRDKNYAAAPWFKDAVAGQFFKSEGSSLTGTVIENVHFSPELQEIYETDGLALGFAAPVSNAKGDVVAVWRNIADFKYIEETLASGVMIDQAARNESIEAIILDEKGTLWAEASATTIHNGAISRDTSVVGKLNLAEKSYAPAVEAVKRSTGFSLHEKHRRTSIDQRVGYTFRNASLGFGGMPWAVMVRMNANEALYSERSLKATVYAGLASSILVCLVGGFIVIPPVLKPIRAVVASMSESAVGDGNLTKMLDESRNDETGDLARSFNKLCGKMREIISEVLESASEVAAASTQISSSTESLA